MRRCGETEVKRIMYLWCLNKNFLSDEQFSIWYLVSLSSQRRNSFAICFINTCFQTINGILDQNYLSMILIFSEFIKYSNRSHFYWSDLLTGEEIANCWFQRGKKHVSKSCMWDFQIFVCNKIVGFVTLFFWLASETQVLFFLEKARN